LPGEHFQAIAMRPAGVDIVMSGGTLVPAAADGPLELALGRLPRAQPVSG
jgi:hypothetical protein